MLKTALVRASLAALSGCFSSEAKPDALRLTNWRRRSCGRDVVTSSLEYSPIYIHSIDRQQNQLKDVCLNLHAPSLQEGGQSRELQEE